MGTLASTQVVACVECGGAIVLTNRAKLYCSDVCHQTLKLIHYGRGVVADGRIERDPTIAEAIQMRIAQILGGGYHEGLRRVPPALRAQIFERDGGKCVLCGAPATQIDHIAGDANTFENLRAACGACNLGMAQAHLVPASPKKAAVAEHLVDPLYEPFCGSGTALIAAERTGARCYAMEIDPIYVEVALARWERFSGQIAVRLDG